MTRWGSPEPSRGEDSTHVHLGYVGDRSGTNYPLALYLLRGYARDDPALRETRFSLSIFPHDVDPERAAREIVAGAPDLVALSCYVWNIEASLALCAALKRSARATPIVLGGPEVSPLARTILEADESPDIIVVGEGEETFREILNAMARAPDRRGVALSREPPRPGAATDDVGPRPNGAADDVGSGANGATAGALRGIAGIAYRARGAVLTTPPRLPIADLADLPSLYEDVHSETIAGHRAVLYETFRGCPYACSFCEWSDPGSNGRLRLVPLERVLHDVRVILRSSVRELFFIDSAINFLPDRALRILQTIDEARRAAGARTMIGVHVWVERITDELSEWMARTRVQALVGLQTFGDLALHEANRRWFRPDRFEAGVDRLWRHDVDLYSIQIIYGLPEDSHEQFRKNVSWVFDRRIRIWCGPLMLLPGTDYARRAEALEIDAETGPPYRVRSSRGYSAAEMDRSHDLAAGVDFYNRTSPGAIRQGAELLGLSPVDFMEQIGGWWRRRTGDASPPADFEALLAFVDRRLREGGRDDDVPGALRSVADRARALRHA